MDLQQSRWRSQRDAMDAQHQRHLSGLVQGPIEQRTQTGGEGRQGHDHFLRAVRQILPPKRWRKRTKQHQRRRDTRSYGAHKVEAVTGYPAGPYGAESVTIYPTYLQAGSSSHPWPYPPLQHNPPLYPPPPPYPQDYNIGPPNQGYYPSPPPCPQDYNIGPPNQGYQPFPPTYSQGYLPPPNQGYCPSPPPCPQGYSRPPNQGYDQFPRPYPPPCPQGYGRPPNQGYHQFPRPYRQGYSRPPNQGYQTFPPPPYQGYQTLQMASSVAEKVVVDLIKNGMDTFFSDVNNDGSYD